MVNPSDIVNVHVLCDRMSFSIKRENAIGSQMKIDFKILGKWGIKAIKPDSTGVNCHAVFTLESNVVSGEFEVTVTTDFNRTLTKEELASRETAKICAVRCAEFIVQWTANISSTMGLTPFIIPVEMVRNMISTA